MAAKKELTIRDIAKMANVSHMTVSRVLNNDPKVREITKQRILKLVEKYNFKPDARARNLVLKRSNLLGLIVPDIRNPFYSELSRGIEDKANSSNYNVIFCSTDGKPGRIENYVNLMRDTGVDGLIFATSQHSDPVIEKLIEERFPLICVSRKLRGENFNYVVVDNFRGAYEMTKHLVHIGYRKIAIISGPSTVSTGLDRLRGYKKALTDHNIDLIPDYIIQGPFEKVTGYEGAIHLLKMKDKPEAIFSGSDYIAMGVIDAVSEHGLDIPKDIAVVGFDDTQFASNKRIMLTTVSQGQYRMGNLAVQILIDVLNKKGRDYTHKVVLEPKIIIRESCGINLKKESDNKNIHT
jgi:LacI family transcriptional regulator